MSSLTGMFTMLLAPVAFVAALLGIQYYGNAKDERQRAKLRAAAATLRMSYDTAGTVLGTVSGQRADVRVRIEIVARQARGIGTDVQVTRLQAFCGASWPSGILLGPRPLRLVSHDIPFPEPPPCLAGDAAFDAAFDVRGDEPSIVLLLDPPTRALLRRWMLVDWASPLERGGGAFLRAGALVLDLPGLVTDPRILSAHLDQMIELGRALSCANPAARLAAGMEGENVELRRKRLAILIDAHRDAPEAREACAGCLGDPDPETRLLAASALGTAGTEALAGIARHEGLPSELRARAVEAWSLVAPGHDAAAALISGLVASKDPVLLRAAWVAAEQPRVRSVLPSLMQARAAVAAGEEARAMAHALRALPGPESEAVLVRLLALDDDAVRIEAARTLAVFGTLASIEPLLPLAKGLLVDGDVKRAAREAIHAIRARLGPVEAGRLSLSDLDDDAGALSPADDDRGALSPADGERACEGDGEAPTAGSKP